MSRLGRFRYQRWSLLLSIECQSSCNSNGWGHHFAHTSARSSSFFCMPTSIHVHFFQSQKLANSWLRSSLWMTTKRTHPSDREATNAKCRQVSYGTFCKWRTELDKYCQTGTWLECDKSSDRLASWSMGFARSFNLASKEDITTVTNGQLRQALFAQVTLGTTQKTINTSMQWCIWTKNELFPEVKVPLLMLQSHDCYMSSQRMLLPNFES